MNKLIPLLAFSLLLFVPVGFQDASAVITVFNDKTTFLTSTSATSATGPLPDLGLIAGGATASQTVGTATFTITPPSSELYIGGAGTGIPGGDWTLLNPGADIAISDIENLNVDLAAPVFAFGFDFVEPTSGVGAGGGFVDSTFSLTLKNGLAIVDSFQFNAPDDVLAFVGVSSDLPFDRVEIRDITATTDDEFWGEFYTSSSPTQNAFATQFSCSANMLGANESPPNASPGIGTLTGTYDDTTNQLSWNISWLGLVAETAMHFHAPAPPGFNAGVQLDVGAISGVTSPSIGNAIIGAGLENDLLAGLSYINLHTQAFPGGELRGQVECIPIEVIGGEIIPIEATSLLLAGLQTSVIWMLPVIVGAAGVGAFYIKTRINKES